MFSKKCLKRFCLNLKQIPSKIHTFPISLKYRNIEYKAQIEDNGTATIKDLLNMFANNQSKTYKGFEVFRHGEYLDLNYKINNIADEKFNEHPPNIVDFDLSLKNLKFRDLHNLKTPSQSHSHKFQNALNEFLEINKSFEFKKADETFKLLKSINNPRNSELKLSMIVASFLKNNFEGINLELLKNIDLEKNQKDSKRGVSFIRNKNSIFFPINFILHDNKTKDSVSNLDSKFDESIIDNLDSLRKLAIQQNTKYNFGFITDLYKWKLTHYIKPDDNAIETDNNFHISLFYDLPLSETSKQFLSTNILMRILKGVLEVDTKLPFIK